jgi:cyclic pyranopterin phosphate synthase
MGDFGKVVAGIETARKAGIKIKINMVALRGVNEDEIEAMVRWCHGEGMDLTLIEAMPLGETGGGATSRYLPLTVVRARLMDRFTLDGIPYRVAPRYVRVRETGDGWPSSRR